MKRVFRFFIGVCLAVFVLPLAAYAVSDVTFQWDSNTELDMASYNIYRSDDGQLTWNKVNAAPIVHEGTGTETWTELGVPDGTHFWYATAVDTSENESPPSNIVTASFDSTAPAPPQNFLITLIQKILAFLKGIFGKGCFGIG